MAKMKIVSWIVGYLSFCDYMLRFCADAIGNYYPVWMQPVSAGLILFILGRMCVDSFLIKRK